MDERNVKVLTKKSNKDYDDAVYCIHRYVKEKKLPQAQYLLAAFKREVQLDLNKRKTSTCSI